MVFNRFELDVPALLENDARQISALAKAQREQYEPNNVKEQKVQRYCGVSACKRGILNIELWFCIFFSFCIIFIILPRSLSKPMKLCLSQSLSRSIGEYKHIHNMQQIFLLKFSNLTQTEKICQNNNRFRLRIAPQMLWKSFFFFTIILTKFQK